MRIGLDLSALHRPHAGVAVYARNLAAALPRAARQAGEEAAFLGFDGLRFLPLGRALGAAGESGGRAPTDRIVGALGRFAGRSAPLLPLARAGRAAAFALGQRRVDLFHALMTLPPGPVLRPLLPLIYDLSPLRHPETHPAARVRAFEAALPRLASAPLINTISEFSRREIVELLAVPPERVAVTTPGVDPLFRAPPSPEEDRAALMRLGLDAGRYLLAVGTLEPRKNLATLVAAYAGLPPEAQARAPLVLAGQPGWGDLRLPAEAARLVAAGRIRFPGYLPGPALRALYRGTALFLFPSLYEGFGLPVLEALACGAPVAVSGGTAMEEAAGDAASRLPAQDSGAWREAMRAAIEAPDLSEAARAARIAWARRFDWAETARATLALYRRLRP
ncbi:MAG: glycosyltransferase family 4 protein [Acetobacteraceae bacterium]|nr:glycosyltransferase family 4 protein [Acetobacteraceae bacterium]